MISKRNRRKFKGYVIYDGYESNFEGLMSVTPDFVLLYNTEFEDKKGDTRNALIEYIKICDVEELYEIDIEMEKNKIQEDNKEKEEEDNEEEYY